MYFNAIPIDFYVVKSFFCIKFGRDKVLMTPHICIDFWAKSVQGCIQGRAIKGQWGGPFSNELLLQTGRLQQQTECIAII